MRLQPLYQPPDLAPAPAHGNAFQMAASADTVGTESIGVGSAAAEECGVPYAASGSRNHASSAAGDAAPYVAVVQTA